MDIETSKVAKAMVNPKHEWLKMQLRLKSQSIASVARELGVLPSTVTLVSQRKTRSRRIETALAVAIGAERTDLFPDCKPTEKETKQN